MNHYTKLAIHYLKMNKRRSVITILGVVLTTTLLVIFLNLAYLALLHERSECRENGDYEMVFFTQSEEQAKHLLEDERIQSAYIGPYYYKDIHGVKEETLYQNSLYVNVTHPYAIERVFARLCSDYGLDGEINTMVAATYFQGSAKDGMVVGILFVLWIAYIMTIFGVGIVRNSIQLNALEHIRDYGNLRCIGATKGQLKGIIYLQGAVLELLGIAVGVLLGAGISMAAAAGLKWQLGFQPFIILLVLIFFMGDLYFTMGENSKLITKMSPVSAIRGEYRIRKEKLQVHKSKLLIKLMGVDGDYAYKSLMRNPKRFYRTVAAMAIGIAMIMTWTGIWNSVVYMSKAELEPYKYYQLYLNNSLNITERIEEVQATLPSTDLLEEVTKIPEVTESRRSYVADVWVADVEEVYGHYTEEYQELSYRELFLSGGLDAYRNALEQEGEGADLWQSQCANLLMPQTVYGYEENEIKRCQAALTAGSLDISEHGLILVNPTNTFWVDEEDGYSYQKVTTRDYQVGDTIDFVNMKRFREMMEQRISEIQTQWEESQKALEQEYKNAAEKESEFELKLQRLEADAYNQRKIAAYECWQELMESGDYETYTIEAILSENPNGTVNEYLYDEESIFILPMEQYYALTGTDETMTTGVLYHLEQYGDSTKLWDVWLEIIDAIMPEDGYYDNAYCVYSNYLDAKDLQKSYQQPMLVSALIIVFVIIMASLNFINATASNLHLRKREFAQLRVIGASKERITRMAVLEGIITTVIADGIGIGLGIMISMWLSYYIGQVIEMPYQFSYLAVVLCVIGSFLLLVGSVYVPMKSITRGMIEDLVSGGD